MQLVRKVLCAVCVRKDEIRIETETLYYDDIKLGFHKSEMLIKPKKLLLLNYHKL